MADIIIILDENHSCMSVSKFIGTGNLVIDVFWLVAEEIAFLQHYHLIYFSFVLQSIHAYRFAIAPIAAIVPPEIL